MSPHISADEARIITIASYNTHIDEYAEENTSDDVRTLIYWPGVQYFLNQLPSGSNIFEIGSGTGADARRGSRLSDHAITSCPA